MNLFQKFIGLFSFQKRTPKNEYLTLGRKTGTRKGLYYKIKRQFVAKTQFQIGKWEEAMMMAKNPDHPQRLELYLLYDWAMLDAHLYSQIRTAHITIQRSAFEVHKNGKLDEDLTELFKRPWFIQYLKHALDAEFWGYSLIEFDHRKENGEFTTIHLIEREHVRPETEEVLLRPYDQKGICYTDKPFNKWIIGIGDTNDLGLLELATREVIYKEYSRRDWSIRSEKFGMPYLVVKTSTTDEKELDDKAEMASEFGANGWTILADDDEYALVEPKNAAGHLIYKDMGETCDKNISKLINGQTSTSDEKSYTGAAEVHERLLNGYSYSRLRALQYHVNFILIPFLIEHGYPLKDANFQFTDLMVQTDESSKKKEKEDGEKKKLTLSSVEQLYLFYTQRKDIFPKITLGIDLDKIVNGAARKVYNQLLKEGDIDANTWLSNVQEIWEGIEDGFGKPMIDFKYSDPSYELMATFRDNIQLFAAFKNHQEISELVSLLKDDTGATRSFSEFKALAEPVIGKYNKNYLEAEYNHAIASAQMSDKWLEFEREKERFPYLRYRAQKDDRVRDDHKRLDGITLPLEHEFWDSFFPPIGWGCRCFVEQTDEPNESQNTDDLPNFEEVPAVFRNNPARTGELFTDQHPYFDGMDNDIAERIVQQKNRFVYNSFKAELYKKIGFDKKTSGYAVQHKKHNKTRGKENEKTAKELSKQGYGVELVEDAKNAPDAIINGKLWSFAHTDPENISKAIKEAAKRSNRVLLVFEMDKDLDINAIIAQAVEGTTIKEVGILNGSKLEFIITE